MSMWGMSSSSAGESYEETKNKYFKEFGLPDPRDYRIIRSVQFKHFLLIQLQYPKCTNYEGNKVLLYFNTTIEKLVYQGSVDPHFFDSPEYISPMARFEPTEAGWQLALDFIEYVEKIGTNENGRSRFN